MAARIPYEIVALEANKILERLLDAKDEIEARDIYQEYEQYLAATGWTDMEFDAAKLKRIDADWEDAPRQPVVNKKHLLN